MQLDHIAQSSKHEVSAEILIENRAPGMNRHVHQARLNLTSTSARKTLANHLHGRNETLPWIDLLEQACVLVLRKHREGTPAIRLADMAVPDGLEFRNSASNQSCGNNCKSHLKDDENRIWNRAVYRPNG